MNSEEPARSSQAGAAQQQSPGTSLRTSHQMVAALLESASQAILAVDREGHIVLANARTEEVFGYSREELTGAALEMLLPEGSRGVHRHERAEYFEHPRVRHMGIGMELAGRRKDGSEFPVEVSLSYVETEQGRFAIAFVTDISQRKQLEEQFFQAQKMEAVGRLAGGVAHDFNNMLTIIAGYNRMMLDALPAEDPLRDYAREVLKAAERAGALTQQLLAFSRRQVMKPRVINVNELLAGTEKMLRRLIGEDLELVLELAADAGNIKADPGYIEQAIFNLAVNARDAMQHGGRLTIETANVELDEAYAQKHLGVAPGAYVMIAVSDTGHGMDAVTRRRIFEPFFTTKEKGKGTGLGLATVYGVVKQTGGDIWVYSEVGKGTTFKLYFPRVRDQVDRPVGEGEQPRPAGTETILVVEDEEGVRELIGAMLRQLGYKVLEAQDARDALRIADEHPAGIDLLLTDVVMPQMSGRKLAEELRPKRRGIKTLYLSGYTESMAQHHGGLEEDADFLPKPFSQEALAGKLREILGR